MAGRGQASECPCVRTTAGRARPPGRIGRDARNPFEGIAVLVPIAMRKDRERPLEEEIDRLQRTEEAIVASTDAPRERGCPPWVVLGAKVIEAAAAHRRVMSR